MDKDKIKLILDDDKSMINNYYNWLLKFYPVEYQGELIKVHEEMMNRRQRELDELMG